MTKWLKIYIFDVILMVLYPQSDNSIDYCMADENTIQSEEENNTEQGRETGALSSESTEADQLRAQIAELEQNVIQLKDQLLRKAAEFENYKRRTENDFASMVRFSTEELITKLLPILDDFERSMKMNKSRGESGANANSADEAGFFRGVELIFNKFKKLLETHGVKEMEVVGKPFDPAVHDALLQIPKNDVPPHTILEEVDKGYMLHDKVIRHARVIVSADISAPEDSGGIDASKNETTQ